MDTFPQFFANVWKGFSVLPSSRRLSILAVALATINTLFMNVAHLSAEEQTALAWRKL